eukprot:gene15775-biopygen21737
MSFLGKLATCTVRDFVPFPHPRWWAWHIGLARACCGRAAALPSLPPASGGGGPAAHGRRGCRQRGPRSGRGRVPKDAAVLGLIVARSQQR